MELEEKAEELLETIWIGTREQDRDSMPRQEVPADIEKAVDELVTAGYVAITDGKLSLTASGEPIARNVIRRHRLAERLLVDVLDTGDNLMHEKACKFEHLLDRGLDDSICSLLGHPRICPHGKPIPPGRCCQHNQAEIPKVVSSLSRLNPGQSGKVAYVYAPQMGELQKLIAMGMMPGAPIKLLQSFPSYVFQVGQTKFAVDKEIADSIYVRLQTGENAAEIPANGKPERRKRHRRRFGLW
jgi:DtxR family Mn-dependent transcriptional regulator